MKARCEVETWELNGKDVRSGATIGGEPQSVIVESHMLHTSCVRIRIGEAHAVVNSRDIMKAIEAATR